MSINRRRFIVRAGQAAALTASLSELGGVYGAASRRPDTLRLGLIGCGGVMAFHSRRLDQNPRTVISWLCDIDPTQLDKQLGSIQQTPAPRTTARFEDVIEDANVDAVVIGTPHHWHVPIALRAIEAGKDVYLEKPMSHVYGEGQRIIAAAARHGRVVHHGTQMRSSPVTEQAAKLLASGILGEVKMAKAWSAEGRVSAPPIADSEPPPGVDYDRWLGPAPARQFNRHRFHRTWRMFRDYGNGEIGDDGIHDLDLACWGLGIDSLPTQVSARGSRMHLLDDASEYPDNMTVVWQFSDGRLIIYEDFPFTPYGQHGYDSGNIFYGTEGYMVFSRRGAFQVYLGPKSKPGPTEEPSTRSNRGSAEHMQRFLEAVRAERPTNAGPVTAHHSCALVHLGEIAYRTRGRLEFDPLGEQFVDCHEANEMLHKTYRAPFGLPEV